MDQLSITQLCCHIGNFRNAKRVGQVATVVVNSNTTAVPHLQVLPTDEPHIAISTIVQPACLASQRFVEICFVVEQIAVLWQGSDIRPELPQDSRCRRELCQVLGPDVTSEADAHLHSRVNAFRSDGVELGLDQGRVERDSFSLEDSNGYRDNDLVWGQPLLVVYGDRHPLS